MPEIDQTTINQLEAQIRRGEHASVRDFLTSVSHNEIPTRFLVALSQLARRIGIPKKGLLLLRDRVVDSQAGSADARETIEYAACLLKLGNTLEARRLLSSLSQSKWPEVSKFLAFTYIHQWDYVHSTPLLQAYVARPEVSSYDRLVGGLNLASGLISLERYAEAEAVLQNARTSAETGRHQLLLGNILELQAQAQIHQRHFANALRLLDQAWEILKHAQPRYRLYLQKWRAVAALMENPTDRPAAEALNLVRSEALEGSEWETVRDCDLYQSLIAGDESLFVHLYFGTPHRAYREFMVRKSGGAFLIPQFYIMGGSNKHLDIEHARWNGKTVVPDGLGLHKMLIALTLDFYSPATVGQLFGHVFTREVYHPVSSPARVHELVRRLKSKLSESKIDLPIRALRQGYKAEPAVALRLTAERSELLDLGEFIKNRFTGRTFRLRELAEQRGLPHTTVYRELNRLVDAGEIDVIGRGKETVYAVKVPQFAEAA